MKNFKLLQPITWQHVFQTWKQQEEINPDWQKLVVQKGWNSWDEWRGYIANMFGAQDRVWNEYEIIEPFKIIPNLYIGPFKSWQKHFELPLTKTFKDLVEEKNEWASKQLRNYFTHEFPEKTQLIGVYIEDLDKIYLIEGHHRATFIALADHNHDHRSFTKNPTIAITNMNSNEMHLFTKMLELGSKNPNRMNKE